MRTEKVWAVEAECIGVTEALNGVTNLETRTCLITPGTGKFRDSTIHDFALVTNSLELILLEVFLSRG